MTRRRLAFLALVSGLVLACRPADEELAEGSVSRGITLTERAREMGLTFRHDNGMTGRLTLGEIMGSGLAFFDYDGDGDLDVFFVQGGDQEGGAEDRMFRNELPPLSFVEVSAQAGFDALGYGMGAAVGDYDRDGDLDLYVTNLGSNQLWQNQGDGRFELRTKESGTDDPRWSTSASWVDVDRDGWLDLYVANYVDFTFATHVDCRVPSGLLDYCGPQSYRGVADRLFRNRGDGSFEDLSSSSGVGLPRRAGLGVVSGDFDGDGWVDLYVANDGEPNFLWRNRGDLTFENTALLAGTAVNRRGEAEASMGVAPGDLDADGREDLFLTHLMRQTNTVYYGVGEGLFEDRTEGSGLGMPSFEGTGFGVTSVDLDRDGWLDIVLVNGAVTHVEKLLQAGDPFPVHQPNQIFRNLGEGRFEVLSAEGRPVLRLSEVSRGLAAGDIDLDGDQDLVVSNNHGPARLLINDTPPLGGFLDVDVQSRATTLLGTKVWIETSGRRSLRTLRSDGSYCTATSPSAFLGAGEAGVESIRVELPDGSRKLLRQPPSNARLVLRFGDPP